MDCKDVINKYNIDGLRIDTVKHADDAFWYSFMQCVNNGTQETDYNNGVAFRTGEYFSGITSLLNNYQSDKLFTSLLSYPMYYTLNDVFKDDSGTMFDIYNRLVDYNNYFSDFSLLTRFIDNPGNHRWLDANSDSDGIKTLQNGLLFLFTFNNNPIVYYGTEQSFNGYNDLNNTEVLWTSTYDETSTMYKYIRVLNQIRKYYKFYQYFDTFNIITKRFSWFK